MNGIIPRNNKTDVRIKILSEHRQADNKFIRLTKCNHCKAISYNEVRDIGEFTEIFFCEYCNTQCEHYIYTDETIILDRETLIKKVNGLKVSISRKNETIRKKELQKRQLHKKILELEAENTRLRREIIKKQRY